jgi:hypothetical protein
VSQPDEPGKVPDATPGAQEAGGDVLAPEPGADLTGRVPSKPDGPADESGEARASRWLRDAATGSFGVTVLAFVLALVIGAVLIVFTTESVTSTLSYFFSKPGDFFSAAWSAVSDAYVAMFRGAVINDRGWDFRTVFTPLTETMTVATPMPALRDAFGLDPTARNRKPHVERVISHHTKTAARIATRNPALSRNLSPSSSGRFAFGPTAGLFGWFEPACVKNRVVSR